jgi:predicted TIM-barrel fold metal-dependent hydrolase
MIDLAEDVLDPDLPIVDAHHHLVDRPETGRYLLPEFLDDVRTGHDVVSTVYIEWASMQRAHGPTEMRPVGEVEFANGVAAMAASGTYGATAVCAGIVGDADLRLGAAVEPVLDALVTAGGGPDGRFKGVRFMTATDPGQSAWTAARPRPDGLLALPVVRAGVAKVVAAGLTFDAWCYHPQIGEVVDLARAFPDARIVLDHVGGPLGVGPYAGRRDEVFAAWSSSMAELAACPNVFVKLGGFGMSIFGFDTHRDATPSEVLAQHWRPYIETSVSVFGADRAMFESNFPADREGVGYATLWNAFKRVAAGCSASEKADLFAGTARRFYGLTGETDRGALAFPPR